MCADNALIISGICRLCTLSIVWKRMGNVWKMGQGVWNYSTIVCFAMQVIISNERMVVIQ